MNYTIQDGKVLNLKTGNIQKGYKNKDGYIRIDFSRVPRVQKMEHRMIWEHHNGLVPNDMEIHHINGVRDDNRIENLALVSHADNVRKFIGKGWTWHKKIKKYQAQRNQTHIGYYDTKCGAYMASMMFFVGLKGQF